MIRLRTYLVTVEYTKDRSERVHQVVVRARNKDTAIAMGVADVSDWLDYKSVGDVSAEPINIRSEVE